ncbi:hypothetical protein DSM104299_03874 [Baekduia alba]|uniref:hypothetical protein n=1 Tax=Baekduia alba TaxID=2997333 RepID=UPI0023414398|nr:hypothetical protein [Baekduia alba]WCB95132.1 hypothetical protein DSM104299_03874 [Baekduia alba]
MIGRTRQAGARAAGAALLATFALTAAPTAHATTTTACPPTSSLASAATLRTLNAAEWKFGARPTGSVAHEQFVDWLEARLRRIPGVRLREQRFTIRRWTAQTSTLQLRVGDRAVALPVAGPVPSSGATGAAGVTAPLVVVADDAPISAATAAGKIVVREAPRGSVPLNVFANPLLSWAEYDPTHMIDQAGTYQGDFMNYDKRLQDMQDADRAGAAGIVFLKDLPRAQIVGHDEPYEGLAYKTPGLWLGSDESKAIRDALAGGGQPQATITLRATTRPVTTRTLLATIPGASQQRLVIDSHTDGTNAVEDNGPIAMLTMARYFAGLPRGCRAKTIELAFSTAHFYQRVKGPDVHVRDGGSEQVAEQLDRDYDKGTVDAVVVLEHLGALEYAVQPRPDGIGMTLRRTGKPELALVGVSDSPKLVSAVQDEVRRYDLRRTALLKGADAPGDHVPVHCSFGGEGTPYNRHLLPTVATIAAPQTLYDPGWGLEGIDFGLMRRQVLAYTSLLRRLDGMSRGAIAGNVTKLRQQRKAGAATCPWAP